LQTENQQTESKATDKLLKRAGALFRQNENDNAEMAAANDLATLLDRVSAVTTQEIETLAGELRLLRDKLDTDRQRIQGDVAKYAELSQAVKRVTANISDSVVSLPSAPGIIP
jgi:hypothetical protein